MKFLVIGLGSMGKRRIRNLFKNNQNNVIGFDIRKDRNEEVEKLYAIKTFDSIDSAMNQNPDVLIISCPPNKHVEYAKYAIENNIHFFSEVNIDKKDKILDLMKKIRNSKIIGVPSCTMRFHPCVKIVKELIDNSTIGKPLLLTYHSGSNLEDWHPWETINDYYVAKKETGGGRDQIMFELEYEGIEFVKIHLKAFFLQLLLQLSKFRKKIFPVVGE